MYVPLHFAPCELLPGLSKLLAWPDLRPDLRALLDDQLIETADDVRGILGVPCWANNYAYGGKRVACGWRSPTSRVGAPNSYHKRGQAVDLHPEGMTANEARAKIREAIDDGKLPHVGGVELGVPWLHIDIRPRRAGKVLWFNP